ncbi:hypothetical protein HWV62_38917 [Athelia sp. TMB]|nr:hypothetical protein HWV62_38917 [Athelia sp. TMB]
MPFTVLTTVSSVMGPTGAGKSTFIDYASRQGGQGIGHTLHSQTSDIRAVRCKHPIDKSSVILVDTPGFDDTNKSDIIILGEISQWFVRVYKQQIPLAAIIYLHRISDNRMGGSPLKNLQMFASMCGKDAMPRVVLGTTMWGEVAQGTGERREGELRTKFWADMISQQCRMVRFGDSYESAWDVIGKLPPAKEGVIISQEIVDDKKRLNETAAGAKLNEELERLIAQQEAAVRQLEQQSQRTNDPAIVAELEKVERRINVVAAELEKLKIPFTRRVVAFFTGRKARKTGLK